MKKATLLFRYDLAQLLMGLAGALSALAERILPEAVEAARRR